MKRGQKTGTGKKILLIVLGICILIGVFSCGTKPTTQKAHADESTGTNVAGMIIQRIKIPFFITLTGEGNKAITIDNDIYIAQEIGLTNKIGIGTTNLIKGEEDFDKGTIQDIGTASEYQNNPNDDIIPQPATFKLQYKTFAGNMWTWENIADNIGVATILYNPNDPYKYETWGKMKTIYLSMERAAVSDRKTFPNIKIEFDNNKYIKLQLLPTNFATANPEWYVSDVQPSYIGPPPEIPTGSYNDWTKINISTTQVSAIRTVENIRGEGAREGFEKAETEGTQAGKIAGDQQGYTDGLTDKQNNEGKGFYSWISAIIQAPLNFVWSFLNFDFLDINMYPIFVALTTLLLLMALIHYIVSIFN